LVCIAVEEIPVENTHIRLTRIPRRKIADHYFAIDFSCHAQSAEQADELRIIEVV